MADDQFSGSNLYEVLGIDANASLNEIKKTYQALVLKYHPDKYDARCTSCTREEATEYFCLIDKAWKTLSDANTRIEYDAKLRDQHLTQDWLFDSEVKLSDMEFHKEYNHYTWPCRCSGSYEITDENLTKGENIICCSTCSLTIRVSS